MKYENIPVLRYMGNKNRLLDEICPAIEALCPEGSTVCDLMAGTCAVGYALKGPRRVFANDVQRYSHTVARALIENPGEGISSERASELEDSYRAHLDCGGVFTAQYADTYFSDAQCRALDALRRAIEPLPEPRRSLYLSALLCAMGRCQSTTGHFAEYLSPTHPRVSALRGMDLKASFLNCCDLFSRVREGYGRAFCLPAEELLRLPEMEEVGCFYLDPPYTADQYSRFYHLLETAILYDEPQLSGKGRYRPNRFRSDFCYPNRAETAFSNIMKETAAFGVPLVVSYSSKGVLPVSAVIEAGKRYYRSANVHILPYQHSSQGSGRVHVTEILLSFV